MCAEFSSEQREKVINSLKEHGVRNPCPRCGNKSFIIAEGYFNRSIQSDLKGFRLGGKTIPTVVTVCDKCGYISEHSLGVLGLLETQEKEGKK